MSEVQHCKQHHEWRLDYEFLLGQTTDSEPTVALLSLFILAASIPEVRMFEIREKTHRNYNTQLQHYTTVSVTNPNTVATDHSNHVITPLDYCQLANHKCQKYIGTVLVLLLIAMAVSTCKVSWQFCTMLYLHYSIVQKKKYIGTCIATRSYGCKYL